MRVENREAFSKAGIPIPLVNQEKITSPATSSQKIVSFFKVIGCAVAILLILPHQGLRTYYLERMRFHIRVITGETASETQKKVINVSQSLLTPQLLPSPPKNSQENHLLRVPPLALSAYPEISLGIHSEFSPGINRCASPLKDAEKLFPYYLTESAKNSAGVAKKEEKVLPTLPPVCTPEEARKANEAIIAIIKRDGIYPGNLDAKKRNYVSVSMLRLFEEMDLTQAIEALVTDPHRGIRACGMMHKDNHLSPSLQSIEERLKSVVVFELDLEKLPASDQKNKAGRQYIEKATEDGEYYLDKRIAPEAISQVFVTEDFLEIVEPYFGNKTQVVPLPSSVKTNVSIESLSGTTLLEVRVPDYESILTTLAEERWETEKERLIFYMLPLFVEGDEGFTELLNRKDG